ncbi:MAG: sulfatase-like hydrolase/transferase [Alphaproteobacteria bacterium]|nr:sulfatase-like hydrolase/transferase [Alphaproteobacteria bacterium]
MFTRLSLRGALAAALLSLSLAPATAETERPNIIIFLADDHGWGDLGVQGASDVKTPNLDRLAQEGAFLTDFYSNHTICAPTRAGFITGRYQHSFGFENARPMDEETPNGLPVDVPTVPERLKALGYATGMTGKWHMGYFPQHAPTNRGFDFYYGTLAGAMAYVPTGSSGLKYVWRGLETEPMPAHVTDAFGAEAVTFIEQHKDEPFFLYVAFTAVHAPLQTTEEYLARFPDETDPDRRIYLGMLAAMDDAVGNVVSAVDRNGLGEKTLILFSGDNGGPTWQTTSANGPLNGVKVLTLEGGIRVPTIARWTGRIPPGQRLPTMGISHDLTATALAVAGGELGPEIDGVNLMPFLTGEASGNAHDQLFWRFGPHAGMREGPWKLVQIGQTAFLFNLDTDIGERNDLSAAEPERFAAMKAAWKAWSDSMPRPAWGTCSDVSYEECKPSGALVKLYEDYVAGMPVDPRPMLYGGGPE